MNLVIVESPAKSKTIEKYLGSDYKVVSSMGHIRDLATSGKYGLGIDIDNDFKPSYVVIKGKNKVISSLKKLVKEADKVYLASDPDREGEAISWHLFDALKMKDSDYDRIVFHEITKPAVLEALEHPRKIDDALVRSQETRRMLDRIIGFRLSKLMQSKTGGTSAGRVQSVALKLIVDREREILAFIPEEYWTIQGVFDSFKSDLWKYQDKEITLKNESEADNVLNSISQEYTVTSVEAKDKKRASKPIFKTSTLQQTASAKLGFPSSKTMKVAQKLYEGMDVGEGLTGLITYMRTDSVRMSPIFINETLSYIEKTYGKNYVGSVKVGKKNDLMQDAHEGIRPTSIYRTPESIKKYLTNDEYNLYDLIYKKALSSLMADALTKQTTVLLDNHGYTFKTTGSVMLFDGYTKVYGHFEDSEDNELPTFKVGDVVTSKENTKEQHFTKPKARYNEGSLIKELEELGIGRPSTYATIIETLKKRDYVVIEDKHFVPTEVGFEITDKLQEFFSSIVNVKYTAEMESDLDKIAENEEDSLTVLRDFYNTFDPLLTKAFAGMEKKSAKETGELCPNCGSPLVERKGKYGKFVACSNYPTCKYIKKEEKEVHTLMKCPLCDGDIIEKKTRKGKIFYGCNHYPKCNFATWDEPTGELCPECGKPLVKKGNKITCSACDYTK